MSKLRKKAQAGFTLLEMLVVLILIGFLLAMVVPRLGDVAGQARMTTCKQSQQTLGRLINDFVMQKGDLPNDLVNIVRFNTSDSSYELPSVEISANDEKETLKKTFARLNYMVVHTLNADEAEEINNLGIAKLYNLEVWDDAAVPPKLEYKLEEVPIVAGVNVLMIGAGAAGSGVTDYIVKKAAAPGSPALAVDNNILNPELIYRIVLGIGPDNELVTSGMIDNVGVCMWQAQQEGPDFTYGYSSLVLPRLTASVARFDTAIPANSPSQIKVEGYDKAGNQLLGERTYTINTAEDVYAWNLIGAGGGRWQEWSEATDKVMWKITALID